MKCRLLLDMSCDPCPEFPEATKPKGTIIEGPKVHWLVWNGCAEPADEECAKAAGLTPERIAVLFERYQMLDAGVTPKDREAWKRGYMRGYNPDGTWIRGPNADEFDQQEWEEYKRNSPLVLP